MLPSLEKKNRLTFSENPLGTTENEQLGSFNINFQELHFAVNEIVQSNDLAVKLKPLLRPLSRPAELRNPVLNRNTKCGALRVISAALRVDYHVC